MGNVTLEIYATRSGETRVDRTIVADSLAGTSMSFIPPRSDAGTGAEEVDPGKPPADSSARRCGRLAAQARPPAEEPARVWKSGSGSSSSTPTSSVPST